MERWGQPRSAIHINLNYNSRNPVPSIADPISLEIIRIVETEDTWRAVHDFSCKNIRQQNPADTIELFLSDLHEDLPKQPVELRYGQIVTTVDHAIEFHLRCTQPLKISARLKAKRGCTMDKTSNDDVVKEEDSADESVEKQEDPSYRGSNSIAVESTSLRRSPRLQTGESGAIQDSSGR